MLSNTVKENINLLGYEVVKDGLGNYDFMVKIPLFYLDDYIDGAPHIPHPAFVVDGVTKPHFYIGKYQATLIDGVARSLPTKNPCSNVTMQEAINKSEAKGSGYHLVTNAEWSAIAMLSYFNNKMPKGNTNAGRDVNGIDGIPSTTNKNIVLSGSGDNSWSTTGDTSGVFDMCGNLYEWVTGLRVLQDGTIQIIKDNNASKQSIDKGYYGTDNTIWSTLDLSGSYQPYNYENPVKYKTNIIIPSGNDAVLSKITNSGITGTVRLKALGILPMKENDEKLSQWCILEDSSSPLMSVRGGHYASSEKGGIYSMQLIRNAKDYFGYRFALI